MRRQIATNFNLNLDNAPNTIAAGETVLQPENTTCLFTNLMSCCARAISSCLART